MNFLANTLFVASSGFTLQTKRLVDQLKYTLMNSEHYLTFQKRFNNISKLAQIVEVLVFVLNLQNKEKFTTAFKQNCSVHGPKPHCYITYSKNITL